MSETQVSPLFPQSFLTESSLHLSLGQEFPIGENGLMVFHWADFHETCDTVRESLESDSELFSDFKRREAGILHLATIPVWIKTKSKVHQTNMYELYERHIFNRSQVLAGADTLGPLDVSFISGTGPFKSMAISECFNKTVYRDFILISLLQGKLPKRDFRVRIKSKVLFEYGEDFSRAQLVNLEQLTTAGLLFSLDAATFQRDFAHCEDFRIILGTDALAEGIGKSLEELKAHISKYAFNLLYSSHKEDSVTCKLSDFSVQSSFDFFLNKKAYLFIPYTKFGTDSENHLRVIREFMAYTKTLVREHYKDPLKKKSA